MISGRAYGLFLFRRYPADRPMDHADRPEVPDDYSSYPPLPMSGGQSWVAHTDLQAFESARRIPVYDPVSDDWEPVSV
jgi:hypothetical protein